MEEWNDIPLDDEDGAKPIAQVIVMGLVCLMVMVFFLGM